MDIAFWKMHGAGNDFILVDDRAQTFPAADAAWLRTIADRRRGVGCEGIILIQPSATSHFRMRFFNPDGGEVEMCGNGARCVARLAAELGVAPAEMRFDTVAGVIAASVRGQQVTLGMTDPKDAHPGHNLHVADRAMKVHFLNTGVPHAVVECPDLATLDVARYGAAIRYHETFRPAGTNANFALRTGPSAIRVRTYERGVEAETLACGTGIVASALVMAGLHGMASPVEVVPTGGDVLSVGFEREGTNYRKVTLTGPAAHAFRGTLRH